MNEHCILPEDGTHVPKHVAEAHLTFVRIRNVHLVGKLMMYASSNLYRFPWFLRPVANVQF